MKIKLNFNHRAKHCLDALDSPFSIDETNEMLNKVIIEYMENDELSHKSELSELIHNRMDYSAILYLATNYVADKVEKRMLMRGLREFLNDEDL
jgi:hypothetical protein